MPPSLSFVIPVLNEGGRLRELLEDLARRFPEAERIVVDGGSSDDTVRLALGGANVLLLGQRGRARQMNLGAAAARGEYLLFLHADSELGFDGTALGEALASGPPWGFCRVRIDSPRRSLRIVSWFMNRRARLTRVATGDQLLFVHREQFRDIGGFADIPLMEDVEICKRLRQVVAPAALDLPVTTSARRWERRGVIATVLQMWWLRLAYWLGAPPRWLWRQYYGTDPV